MKDYKEVDERLFEKLKEFIVCRMEDVDTTHDAPHFCDGEIVCLKDCYKWKVILEEIHSEIQRAEKGKELKGARELVKKIEEDIAISEADLDMYYIRQALAELEEKTK